jgi:acetyltransferase-like isoleucine patch superfamily enzyme
MLGSILDKLNIRTSDGKVMDQRSFVDLIQMGNKILPMLVRGLWLKPFLRHTAGLLLIGKGANIRNPQYVSLGRNFVAEDYCEIQGLSTQGLVFGDRVTVGRFAMIRPSGYYGRDIGVGLRVGNRSNIGANCYIGCSGGIEIGENVMMSPGVSLFAENHNFVRTDIPMKDQGVTRKMIVIEDDCWLASGSTILAGVRVGRGSVVAAGAVVTSDVPPYAIAGGVPAKVIGWRKQPGQNGDRP